MKSICVLTFLVLGACAIEELTDEQKSRGEQIAKYCLAQFEIAPEQVSNLQQGDLSGANQQVKCFANCILEQLGILKGGILQERDAIAKLSEIFDPAKAKEVVRTCKRVRGTNPCDTAFKLYECYLDNKAIFE